MTNIESHCIESQLPSHIFRGSRAGARFDVDFAQSNASVRLFGYPESQPKCLGAQWIQRYAGAPAILTSANFERLNGSYLSDLTWFMSAKG